MSEIDASVAVLADMFTKESITAARRLLVMEHAVYLSNDQVRKILCVAAKAKPTSDKPPRVVAAEILCRIYFDIASEQVGEAEVRRRRDEKLNGVSIALNQPDADHKTG